MLVGPKWFLALDDATHLGPYVGDGPAGRRGRTDDGGLLRSRRRTGQRDARDPRSQKAIGAAVSTISSARQRAAVPAPRLIRRTAAPPRRERRQIDRQHRAPTIVYLDHAATTPMRPEAVAAMLPFLADTFGNPSGSHRVARVARRALDDAREVFAGLVGARPSDIVFTSGGTEADNLAIAGVAVAAGDGAVQRRRAPCGARGVPGWRGQCHRGRPPRRRRPRPARGPARREGAPCLGDARQQRDGSAPAARDRRCARAPSRPRGRSCTPMPYRGSAGSMSPR